jgi:hypothetical protein
VKSRRQRYTELLATNEGRDLLDKAIVGAHLVDDSSTFLLDSKAFWLFVAAYERMKQLEKGE